jgi:hypothetical protein
MVLLNISICSLGADLKQLSSVAIARIHGELAKDGREPASPSSFNIREKSTPRNAAIVKFSDKKKGSNCILPRVLFFTYFSIVMNYDHIFCCTTTS